MWRDIFRAYPDWSVLNDVKHNSARAIYGEEIKMTSERDAKTKNRLKIVIRGRGDTFSLTILGE